MTRQRLEAFSDAVFAIVATLLILEVHIPAAEEPTVAMLIRAAPQIAVFALSFILVGSYWIAHHTFLTFIAEVDRRLLWLNLLLLLAVAVMPLPAAMLAEHPTNVVAIRAYGIALGAANLLGSVFWLYATRDHSGGVGGSDRRWIAAVHALPAVFYGLAGVLAHWSPPAALVIYVAVPAFFVLPNPILDYRLARARKTIRPPAERRGPENQP